MNINGGSLSSSPRNFAELGDLLYFQADAGTRGTELWRTDGTAANTDQVKNINATAVGEDSSPYGLTQFGGFLYFGANDGTHGFELWRTDGTGANTTLVKDINPLAPDSSPFSFTALGGFLYFPGAG